MRRLLLLAAFLPALCQADLHYTLVPDVPAKQIRISLTLDDAKQKEEFQIPAWCPGFYFLLNYETKVSDFKATDPAGQILTVRHSGARAWVVDNPSKTSITISYRVLADDPGLGFFRVSVWPHTAFVNGPGAFVYPSDHLAEKAFLKINVPTGWQIATSMDPDTQAGSYVASGYDELIDHPIQLGKFQRRQFKVAGIPFEAVYVSTNPQQYAPDLDAETERLRRVSEPAIKMFGGAPFKRYTYFLHLAIGDFAGGLEHRASNVQAVSNHKPLDIDDLAAHEYFHAWNVKQIRPKVLGPFDYTQQQRTANLWFAEGVTDYYSKLHTYQSGLQDQEWLLDQLAAQIGELEMSRVRLTKTVEDASREAWENGGFGIGDLSYYTKGLVIGLLLDAEIRATTKGAKSLDDVMRLMYSRYRLPKPGYDEDGVLAAINEASGHDMTALYKKMVRTTDPMPYELLKLLGLRLIAPRQNYADVGFTVIDGTVKTLSPATESSGLRVGDKIVSVNGVNFGGRGSIRLDSSDRFEVVAERAGHTRQLNLPVVQTMSQFYELQRDPFATEEAAKRGDAWLKRLGGIVDGHNKSSNSDDQGGR